MDSASAAHVPTSAASPALRLTPLSAGAMLIWLPSVPRSHTRRRKFVSPRLALCAVLLWSACAAAQGGVATTAARDVAAGCAACHGTNGVSITRFPSLAGMPRADMVKKMQAFRNGTREGTVMPQLARGYTDAQIELAAAWFAAQSAGGK